MSDGSSSAGSEPQHDRVRGAQHLRSWRFTQRALRYPARAARKFNLPPGCPRPISKMPLPRMSLPAVPFLRVRDGAGVFEQLLLFEVG